MFSVATGFTSLGRVDADNHTVMPNAMGVKLNASINNSVIISVAAGSSTASSLSSDLCVATIVPGTIYISVPCDELHVDQTVFYV